MSTLHNEKHTPREKYNCLLTNVYLTRNDKYAWNCKQSCDFQPSLAIFSTFVEKKSNTPKKNRLRSLVLFPILRHIVKILNIDLTNSSSVGPAAGWSTSIFVLHCHRHILFIFSWLLTWLFHGYLANVTLTCLQSNNKLNIIFLSCVRSLLFLVLRYQSRYCPIIQEKKQLPAAMMALRWEMTAMANRPYSSEDFSLIGASDRSHSM